MHQSPERRSFLAYHVKSRDLADQIAGWMRAGVAPDEIWTRAQESDSTASWTTMKGTRFYAEGESPAMDEVLFVLGEDEVSDPIPFSGGYTVARVLETQDPHTIPFEEIAQKLKGELWADKADRRLDEFIAGARDSLDIVVHEDALAELTLTPPEGWVSPREMIFGDAIAEADIDD
jgi:hypothetical protein